jgi:hypothetical protein
MAVPDRRGQEDHGKRHRVLVLVIGAQCEYNFSPPLYLSNPRPTIISGYVLVPD